MRASAGQMLSFNPSCGLTGLMSVASSPGRMTEPTCTAVSAVRALPVAPFGPAHWISMTGTTSSPTFHAVTT
jgi:hypothetical protein